MYRYSERKAALDAAVTLLAHQPLPPSAAEVTAYATVFLGWITGAASRHHRRPDHL